MTISRTGLRAAAVALILPLPAKAELDVADVDTLGQLQRATAPDVVERRVLRGLQLPVIGGAAGDGGDAGRAADPGPAPQAAAPVTPTGRVAAAMSYPWVRMIG
ncbi:DUF2330 domain-containing protein [Janibacter indicus]